MERKKVVCENGHIFDRNTWNVCPICSSQIFSDDLTMLPNFQEQENLSALERKTHDDSEVVALEGPYTSNLSFPVAWLVALGGPYAGKALECKSGKTRIGRNSKDAIKLSLDETLENDTQAVLIYDAQNRSFFIQAGPGDDLVYLNNEVLFDHKQIFMLDRIKIGKSDFLFYPLCGENFTWEDYTKSSSK